MERSECHLQLACSARPKPSPYQLQNVRRDVNYGLFLVNDGHSGVAAADFVADRLPAFLKPLLPCGAPPSEGDSAAHTAWRHSLQRAITVALALLHRSFAARGVLAGCTCTIVLQARHPQHSSLLVFYGAENPLYTLDLVSRKPPRVL